LQGNNHNSHDFISAKLLQLAAAARLEFLPRKPPANLPDRSERHTMNHRLKTLVLVVALFPLQAVAQTGR
jgi:hypothetical protein